MMQAFKFLNGAISNFANIFDNNLVGTSSTILHSELSKWRNAYSYHPTGEAIAGWWLGIEHIPCMENPADILTKPFPWDKMEKWRRRLPYCITEPWHSTITHCQSQQSFRWRCEWSSSTYTWKITDGSDCRRNFFRNRTGVSRRNWHDCSFRP